MSNLGANRHSRRPYVVMTQFFSNFFSSQELSLQQRLQLFCEAFYAPASAVDAAAMMWSVLFNLVICSLANSVMGGTNWHKPDGTAPQFSQVFHDTNMEVLSWSSDVTDLCDLWVAAIDSDYAVRLSTNMNLSTVTSFPWRISVGSEEIDITSQYKLFFIPTGTNYAKNGVDYIASPGFQLYKEGQPTPTSSVYPSTTSLATESSIVETVVSPFTPAASEPASEPTDASSGLATWVKGVITAAVVCVVVLVAGLLLWALRLRRKVKAANNHRSSGIVPSSGIMPERNVEPTERRISGLHEVKGDNRQPLEMTTVKEPKVVYEMPG